MKNAKKNARAKAQCKQKQMNMQKKCKGKNTMQKKNYKSWLYTNIFIKSFPSFLYDIYTWMCFLQSWLVSRAQYLAKWLKKTWRVPGSALVWQSTSNSKASSAGSLWNGQLGHPLLLEKPISHCLPIILSNIIYKCPKLIISIYIYIYISHDIPQRRWL